jgi:hypothetical protein
MMNLTDFYIARLLKKMAGRHHPPAHIRARLLEAAGRPSFKQYTLGVFSTAFEPAPQNYMAYYRNYNRRFKPAEWTNNLINWGMVCSFTTSTVSMKVVL